MRNVMTCSHTMPPICCPTPAPCCSQLHVKTKDTHAVTPLLHTCFSTTLLVAIRNAKRYAAVAPSTASTYLRIVCAAQQLEGIGTVRKMH